MNKEWSELNKTMQTQIKKKDTYEEGIGTLFDLRNRLMETLTSFNDELCRKNFDAIPFINADGYHSKTIAYSIWHIFRIEDIVAHTLINEDEQVFFAGNYQERFSGKPFIVIECGTYDVLMKNVMEDADPFPYDLTEDELLNEVKYSLRMESYPKS